MDENYKIKYFKYKNKYLKLKNKLEMTNQSGGRLWDFFKRSKKPVKPVSIHHFNFDEKGKGGGVLVKFSVNSKEFYVLSTHLSSGRGESNHSDRKKEIQYIINILDKDKTIPFLVAGDFNEHIQFPLLSKDNEGNPLDKDGSIFNKINKSFPELNWWDGVKNNSKDEMLESAKTNLTVNKIRGPGTNQPFKANEYEHQFIDWNFGRNIKFTTLDRKLQKKVSKQIYGDSKKLILQSSIPVINDESYNKASGELNNKLIPNNSTNNGRINCVSDHLPMTYKINVSGNNLNVLQMNLLAQGLSQDGFLGGSSPEQSMIDIFNQTRNNVLQICIGEINSPGFILEFDEGGEKINQLGYILQSGKTSSKEELIKLLEEIAAKMPINTIDQLLTTSKKVWERFGPVLKTSKYKKKEVANRLFKKDKNNMYTFIQCLLGVNNSEITLNSGKIAKGPWALHSKKIIDLEQRREYLKQLIKNSQPDIVCFQEDDFSWNFMYEMGYTCHMNNTLKITHFELGDNDVIKDREIPYSGHVGRGEPNNPIIKNMGDLFENKTARFVKVPGNGKYTSKLHNYNDGITIWWKVVTNEPVKSVPEDDDDAVPLLSQAVE
jgi:hypothetical protein